MCVAVAIVAGIAATGTITAAKMQSNAAKDAAKTSSDAADKALAFQKEQYAQQRKDFEPYAQNGVSAANRLQLGATAPAPVFRPGQPMTLADMGQPQMPQGTTPGPGAPMPMPQSKIQSQGGVPQPPMSLANMGQPGVSPNGPMGQQPPPQGVQPGLVMVQGPDGSSRQLPQPVAQQLVQSGRGFKVIAGG